MMGTVRTYKYRIYPTKAQATHLENPVSMGRHLYNWALMERKKAYIQVPRIGNLKVKFHRPLPETAEVKTLTVKKEFGKWFACFAVLFDETLCVWRDVSDFRYSIDVGLIDLKEAYDVHVKSAPNFQRLIKRLARLEGNLDGEKKCSREWCRRQKAIEKVQFKLRCLQTDFFHKEVNRLLRASNMILHEELDVRMFESDSSSKRDGVKKKMADVGWCVFLQILRYKASDQGKQVLSIPTQYTTDICVNCGTIFRKRHSKSKQYCQCRYSQPQAREKTVKDVRIGLDTLAAQAAFMPGAKSREQSLV